MAGVVSAQVLLIAPAHTSPVALRVIIGMATNVWLAAILDQVGQIRLPDHKVGVNPLQAVVVPALIGITVVAPVEVLTAQEADRRQVVVVRRHFAKAVIIGILDLAAAVQTPTHRPPLPPTQHQARPAQPQAAPVRLDITG